LAKKDDFSVIPNELLKIFGRPQLVMLLPENKLDKVPYVSKEKLLQELSNNSYWLYIKPEDENLLKQHHEYLSRRSIHE
jgi:Uncharacterized protein conserved in bacteria